MLQHNFIQFYTIYRHWPLWPLGFSLHVTILKRNIDVLGKHEIWKAYPALKKEFQIQTDSGQSVCVSRVAVFVYTTWFDWPQLVRSLPVHIFFAVCRMLWRLQVYWGWGVKRAPEWARTFALESGCIRIVYMCCVCVQLFSALSPRSFIFSPERLCVYTYVHIYRDLYTLS